jgi:hypothetical protein
VATVGSVLAVLRGLDPDLPLGALRVERHGEMTDFDLGDVVEVHVESDRVSGRPLSVWAVVGLQSTNMPAALFQAVPERWTVTRSGCGCVASVPVLPGRKVSTLAAPCPHYTPSRIARAFAALEPVTE